MPLTDEEIAYLQSQPIARIATVSANGQPDVVPLAYEFDGTDFWIGGPGSTVMHTRNFHNVLAGNAQLALLVDDVMSNQPFIARGVRVYGRADTEPMDRIGMLGPGSYLRIVPTISWSWNMRGEPMGDTWYAINRTVHRPSDRKRRARVVKVR